MRRFLGPLLLVALLTACGEDDEQPRATDPPQTRQTDVIGDGEVVTIVSASAAGGEVSEEATVLDEQGDLARYVQQFESPTLAADVTSAVRAVPLADGRVAGVAVISIGCDVPPSATVTEEGDTFVVMPGKVTDPQHECFAPVTSVAVLDLPVR